MRPGTALCVDDLDCPFKMRCALPNPHTENCVVSTLESPIGARSFPTSYLQLADSVLPAPTRLTFPRWAPSTVAVSRLEQAVCDMPKRIGIGISTDDKRCT